MKGDSMESSYARLENLLLEEKALFQMLLRCLNDQKQALVSNDVEKIGEMVESTKEVVWRLRRVHSERERVSVRLSPAQGGDLTSVIAGAPAEQRERVQQVIDQMKTLIDAVRRVNSSNVILSASGLEYLSKCVEILLGQQDELVMYGNGKDSSDDPPSAHFVDHSA
jgi:flagellar biosynthesis/type III secretory pathway chaperone